MARRRCERLRASRLVTSHPTLAGAHQVWLPTARGLHRAGYDGLDLPTFAVGRVHHCSAVVDIASFLERRDEVVVSEREIRASCGGATPTPEVRTSRVTTHIETGPLFCVPVGNDVGIHLPDLVVIKPPDEASRRQCSVAVEVELAVKSRSRLQSILGAYASAVDRGELGGVIYYAATVKVAAAVRRAAAPLAALGPGQFAVHLLDPALLTLRRPATASGPLGDSSRHIYR
jgi:hypothetical protein